MSIGVNRSSVNSGYWGGAYQRSFSFVFSLSPDSDQPGLGGVGCKAVPVGRSVQPCS